MNGQHNNWDTHTHMYRSLVTPIVRDTLNGTHYCTNGPHVQMGYKYIPVPLKWLVPPKTSNRSKLSLIKGTLCLTLSSSLFSVCKTVILTCHMRESSRSIILSPQLSLFRMCSSKRSTKIKVQEYDGHLLLFLSFFFPFHFLFLFPFLFLYPFLFLFPFLCPSLPLL